jgi:hypothetical protein
MKHGTKSEMDFRAGNGQRWSNGSAQAVRRIVVPAVLTPNSPSYFQDDLLWKWSPLPQAHRQYLDAEL